MSDDAVNAANLPTILLVDDTPAKLLTYETMLAGVPATLLTAGSAREALRTLLSTDVALVLTDVQMPTMDGYELAKLIREHPRYRQIPIIFVTAVAQSEVDFLHGYASGAVDYVSVPTAPSVLRAKVKVFLDLFTQQRELERLKSGLEVRVAERTGELENYARQLTVLVRELQHRTKNLIAVIQSIVTNTLSRSPDIATASTALLGRLHALGLAQDFAVGPSNSGVSMRSLVETQLAAFIGRIEITGEPLVVGGSFAQSIALIIHELATNAAKYGALSSSQGSVSLTWSVSKDDFELRWLESGGPPVMQPRETGFGGHLLTLFGDAKTVFAPAGLEYHLTTPWAEVLKGSDGAVREQEA